MVLPNGQRGCVAAVGGFDGVHGGHRYLLEMVVRLARERGLDAVAVTFAEHPLRVVGRGQCPPLLSSPEEKEAMLRQCGTDRVVMLDFTKEMSMMSARDFMSKVLLDALGVKVLVMGYDHRFGHDGGLAFEDYAELGRQLGIEVVRAGEWGGDGVEQKFSSSEVRNLLLAGDVDKANGLLGYRYGMDGVVVGGFRVGRTIGFPTANIEPVCADKLVPGYGVYAVEAKVQENGTTVTYAGMMNIGFRPTLNNGSERSIEVHILDFNGEIYSSKVRIEFVARLRDEKKFASVDELRTQLAKDEAEVRCILLPFSETASI
jgi:riboflavin kinase/FMN adenylyltransferase